MIPNVEYINTRPCHKKHSLEASYVWWHVVAMSSFKSKQGNAHTQVEVEEEAEPQLKYQRLVTGRRDEGHGYVRVG